MLLILLLSVAADYYCCWTDGSRQFVALLSFLGSIVLLMVLLIVLLIVLLSTVADTLAGDLVLLISEDAEY